MLLIYEFHPNWWATMQSQQKVCAVFLQSTECIFEFTKCGHHLLECRKISCNFFHATFPELITDKQANSIREMHSINPSQQSEIPVSSSSALTSTHTFATQHEQLEFNFPSSTCIKHNIFHVDRQRRFHIFICLSFDTLRNVCVCIVTCK